MLGFIERAIKKLSKRSYKDMAPEDIFMDSTNLPSFDVFQFEGRMEKPITSRVFVFFIIVCALTGLGFAGKLWSLQVVNGSTYKERSENNRLRETIIVAPRGIIYSRDGVELAWNEKASTTSDFPKREYIDVGGFGNLLGFIKYPAKDKKGFYYEEEFVAKDGVENYFNELLAGKNGKKLTEVAVDDTAVSESTIEPPRSGSDLILSIDSDLQREMYKSISELAQNVNFKGGGGIIMDIHNGEILALASYPEYSSKVMTEGDDKSTINGYFNNPQNPFLNRVISGLYTPGSIVKPFLAFAALEEEIISPYKQIVSTGRLVVPNPYNPDQPTIFKDWKAHGATDMRRAIAVSSDVYFYQIGGGFQDQKGLGVANIKKYLEKFGFTKKTGFDFEKEEDGVIPDPAWKEKNFPGDPWRVGDTYNTSIGQYGMKVTPIQSVRAVAALANGGYLIEPTFMLKGTSTPSRGERIEGDIEHFRIALEGMKLAVEEGTAKGLNMSDVRIAAKTGTAELGAKKEFVNSWVIGFFPYEKPKYAFAIVMERGPVQNLIGATSAMRRVMDYVVTYKQEYIKYQ